MLIKKDTICIHHTAMYAEDDIAEQFDAVNNSHYARWDGKTRSKLGFYGGYHYIVERNGAIQKFRGEDEVGAHNNEGLKRIGAWMYSANYYAIGITFAGNMSRQNLTKEQLKAGVELIKDIQMRRSIPDENVLPHRSYKPTQCPGNNIPDNVWEYLQETYNSIGNKKSAIQKWHEKNKIMEKWSNPPTIGEFKIGWSIYKGLKRHSEGGLDFNL